MPFAAIFVPDFAVEAFLRLEPELRSQAVVVLEGKVPLQKVFAVNPQARRAGAEPGMTKLQLEACGGFVLRPRSHLQEQSAHAALLDCAQSFSPRVEDLDPGTVVLDLAGLGSLFGSSLQIARQIAQRTLDLGLEANVAVAANPDAAMLAARGLRGVTVISEGEEAERLGGLPVEILLSACDLEEDRKAELMETFNRWGLRHIHALAELPEVGLSERLGQEGVRVQAMARGAVCRTLVPVEAPLIFEEAAELEYPLVLLEPLAFLLSRMLEQLCARLQFHSLATQELRLELELENGVRDTEDSRPVAGRWFRRTLRLPVPLLDPQTFLKLLQLDLKANPPGAPIVKVRLAAEPVRPRAAQGGLFLPPAPEPEKLELTLARIAGIVGAGRAGAVQLLDTHRRDGFCMQRFAPGAYASANEEASLVTALRIFRPAVRALVTLQEGRPNRISTRRKQMQEGEILWSAGPWRISGDWWEQPGWSRDEWDIAVQSQAGIAMYRLVRDLLRGEWFLEGEYD